MEVLHVHHGTVTVHRQRGTPRPTICSVCVWVGGCDCSHSDVSKWLESASEPNRPVFWSYFVFLTSQMENSRAVLPNTVAISPT